MASVKESNINDNTLIGLDKICFAINSIETEKEKIEKNPTKADFIKAPMALFAFDTEVEKVVVAKLDVDASKLYMGLMDLNQLKGLSMSEALDIGESDEYAGKIMAATITYLGTVGVAMKKNWANVKWSGNAKK
tara:strand:+ start:210 stop:611 length:402 start_codon:yes stop_codon:yes gene_type:complete